MRLSFHFFTKALTQMGIVYSVHFVDYMNVKINPEQGK